MTPIFIKMVNSYLTETPMVLGDDDEDYDIASKDAEYASMNGKVADISLNLHYKKLFDVKNIEIYQRTMPNGKIIIVGIDPEVTSLDVNNHKYYNLAFYYCVSITKNVPNQIIEITKRNSIFVKVNGVFTEKEYRNYRIASETYNYLAKNGYVVISDSEQYPKAVSMWKKLAKEQDIKGLNVVVFDTYQDEFITSIKGESIYGGKNIDDSAIWSELDTSHLGKLLFLFEPKM